MFKVLGTHSAKAMHCQICRLEGLNVQNVIDDIIYPVHHCC